MSMVQQMSGPVLLDTLLGAGLARRDLARVADASISTVARWRQGREPVPLQPYARLMQLHDLLLLVGDHLTIDPIVWLEHSEPHLGGRSPLDVLAAGRPELVLALLLDPAFTQPTQPLTSHATTGRSDNPAAGIAPVPQSGTLPS